ncbi:protein spinster homolog 3-like isoform X2 [Vicugna pacos]|uniref:Protein spinster homolog 3-like isoform X2 n=1 Tax=Vicugna pacos TaxID=30538 RepID=A0ABM5D062_VICPA
MMEIGDSPYFSSFWPPLTAKLKYLSQFPSLSLLGPSAPRLYWGAAGCPLHVSSSLHQLPDAVCAPVWLPGRPAQPQGRAELRYPVLVRSRPLQFLHPPPQYSWLFFLSRGLVGIGTASSSIIAPTILCDLFVRDQRTQVLTIFYIFIAVGSGLGYVLGSAVTELTGNWRWALRVMSPLEVLALILLIVLVPNPPRGAAEKQGVMAVGGPKSSWYEDVRYLGRNWSFVCSNFGLTAVAFVTGALGFWAPKFLFEARMVHGLQFPCFLGPCNSLDSLILGALTVVTGIIGVILGAEASRRYKKVNPRAEPLICAVSLFAAAVSFYLAFVLAPATLQASYAFLALGELLLSCSCAVVADILLSVVVPRCWGTAGALQITVSHILGDAGSPYLTGLISSALRDEGPDSHLQHFLSLRRSFLCLVFVIILGGGCFWLTTLHLERDQALAQQPGPGTPDNKDMDGKATESQPLLPGTSASTKDH